MVFKAFELKITDLPKVLKIEMPQNASASDLDEMVESVRTQVVYNSRSADEERPVPAPNVEVLDNRDNVVTLKIVSG